MCAAAISIAVGLTAPAASAASADGVLVQHSDGRITVERRGAASRSLTSFAARTTRRAGVRFAEPNRRYRAAAAPGDPLFGEQWSLADDTVLGAGPAWDQTTGGDVTVAVIDSGVDTTHPDLAQNIWTNPAEVAGNGVDDDGNGFVDDAQGWNFVANSPNARDDNGHGTHVAGIIGARGGNGIGVAGVAWRVKIMPIKVLDAGAVGSAATLALGIRYAVANGAKVINLSVSGPGYSRAFDEAVQFASDSGVLVVGAAGNDGRSVDAAPVYPAAFQAPLLVAVAATAQDGGLSPISNYGAGNVELAAPGQDIVSTAAGGGYERRTGTSMATPHVAGALVLLAAARPDLGPVGWRDAVLGAARRGLPVSAGALNLSGALQSALGTQYKSSMRRGSASLRRSTCSLRRAKAISASVRRSQRGKLYVNRAGSCTSSAGGGKLGL